MLDQLDQETWITDVLDFAADFGKKMFGNDEDPAEKIQHGIDSDLVYPDQKIRIPPIA